MAIQERIKAHDLLWRERFSRGKSAKGAPARAPFSFAMHASKSKYPRLDNETLLRIHRVAVKNIGILLPPKDRFWIPIVEDLLLKNGFDPKRPFREREDAARAFYEMRTDLVKRMWSVSAPTPPLDNLPTKAQKLLKQAADCHNPGLALMPYQQFLTTKYWFLVRLAKMEEAKYRCERCGYGKTIQTHHLSYTIRGREHLNMRHLQVLCDRCHAKVHGK